MDRKTQWRADAIQGDALPLSRWFRWLYGIRIEHLWVLLALSIIGAFLSLVPTRPNDFWWHLKIGELITYEGIPSTNRFAWTIPLDAPFTYQSWLGEWLFYALYSLGGFPLIIATRNILGILTFGLVALEAKYRGGSWRWAAGVILLAAAMSINNFTTRTQIWSWVPFILVLIILSRYIRGNLAPHWLVFLPLIMVFWVNAHGAFVMGLLVGGGTVVGETIRALLHQPQALQWDRLKFLLLAFGAMVLSTLLNPLGIGVIGYVHNMLQDTPSQSLIVEWQSPTPRNLAGMFFYLGVLTLLVAFAFARRRPTFTDVLLVCGLTWQAFIGARYVLWFGMLAMPLVAQSLAPLPPRVTSSPIRYQQHKKLWGNIIVLVLLIGLVGSLQPWFKPLWPFPQPYQSLFVEMRGAPLLFSADTPVRATEHLIQEPCNGNLFNEMGYGSYLIWKLEAPVFIDPRVELYPMSLWQDYLDLTKGQRVAELLDTYAIACVLLDTSYQPGLARTMQTLEAWHQTYADKRSEVWRRTP